MSSIDRELKDLQQEINEPQDSNALRQKEDLFPESENSENSQTTLVKDVEKKYNFTTYFNRKFLRFQDPLFKATNTTTQNFFIYAMAMTSIGGVLFWVGAWNFLDNHLLPHTLWSELGCVFFGVILLVILALIYEIPFLKRMDGTWKGWIVFTIRDSVAAFLVVVIWKGIYNLFDVFIYHSTWYRAILYTILGLFIMIVSGTIGENTNV